MCVFFKLIFFCILKFMYLIVFIILTCLFQLCYLSLDCLEPFCYCFKKSESRVLTEVYIDGRIISSTLINGILRSNQSGQGNLTNANYSLTYANILSGDLRNGTVIIADNIITNAIVDNLVLWSDQLIVINTDSVYIS